ncbi:MAG: efflux RND transporter periplasmic adaptor subunit [Cyanobacteria bacterium J06597_1]
MTLPTALSKSTQTEALAAPPGCSRRTRSPSRLWVWVGVCGLLLSGLAVARLGSSVAQGEAESQAERIEILPVETLILDPVTGYETARAYTGNVTAQRASELGFERSGQLVDILVREGQVVVVDQPLAQLDTQNLQAQRRQLEAEVARAAALLAELRTGPRVETIAAAQAAVRDLEQQLLLQRSQYSRREYLFEEGAISEEELDEFSFGQNALQARLERERSNLVELQNGTRQEQIAAQVALVQQLEASLADLEVTIGKSTLRAPFDGIIATQSIDEGTVIGAGESVVELVEAANLEARIGIPARTAVRLQVGDREEIRLGSQVYPATIAAILPTVDFETRTQTVVFLLEHVTPAQVAPGQTARVELVETVPTDGFWLPTDALTQGIRGLWNCYVVTQPVEGDRDTYAVQQKAVEILHQTGDRMLVRGTLQPGDRVVVSGTHRLVSGQQVNPL